MKFIFLFACVIKHLLAHNEDASPSVYNTAYLVTLNVKSTNYGNKKSPSEEITAYCYPAHMPGNAFGCNKQGFVFGVNAVYPKLLAVDRIRKLIELFK